MADELLPLPLSLAGHMGGDLYCAENMRAYARACIAALPPAVPVAELEALRRVDCYGLLDGGGPGEEVEEADGRYVRWDDLAALIDKYKGEH